MPALGHRAYLGVAPESSWGVAETSGFQFGEFISEAINLNIQEIVVPQINTTREYTKRRQGRIDPAGPFSFFVNPDDLIGYMLKGMLWSQSAIVQVATLTVNSSNNKLDFNIGGSQLTATIASATYKPGNTQADTGTLCKAIYDAIVAAEAVGVYTVSFSNSTKKFTITRSAGTLNLLWNTGTNTATSIKTLLGFDNTDDTGALTYTSDSALTTVLFNHTFLTGDTNPGGMTLKLGRDADVFDIAGAMVTGLNFNAAVGELLRCEPSISAKSMVAQATAGSPSFSTQQPYIFHEGVLTLDGSSTDIFITNFALNLNPNLKSDRYFLGSAYRRQQQSGMIDVTGNFTKTFEGAGSGSAFAKFTGGSAVAVVLTFTGAVVGASNTKFILTVPESYFNGPMDANASGPQNELFQPVPFRGIYNSTALTSIKAELINSRGTAY